MNSENYSFAKLPESSFDLNNNKVGSIENSDNLTSEYVQYKNRSAKDHEIEDLMANTENVPILDKFKSVFGIDPQLAESKYLLAGDSNIKSNVAKSNVMTYQENTKELMNRGLL